MRFYLARLIAILGLFGICWLSRPEISSQEVPQSIPLPGAGQAPPGDDPSAPRGVEVQARGPVHEAFATPTGEPKPTGAVNKKPPAPLDEMAPEDKPEGDMVWIAGYWGWDDDRADFMWVTGCWRAKPQGKDWVPGYWREQSDLWQWVPGFWANAATKEAPAQEVTYYPAPPVPPQLAPPGDPPAIDMMYVPGNWYWYGNRYVWRAGYWTRGRAGYIYVASHYRWTPSGYVFVPGYWDLDVAHRGVLYAPVVVDPVVVVGGRFVYTPYYAVPEGLVVDALFVRPATCHYYFGDYYGPRYQAIGFESAVVYGRGHYDSIIVYERWEHRDNPRWLDLQVNVVIGRDSGRLPLPPRTVVTNVTNVRNVTNVTNVTNVRNVTNVTNTTIGPAKTMMAAQGIKSVPVDAATRNQIRTTSQAVQQASYQQRQKTEVASAAAHTQPKTASYNVPAAARSASSGQGGLTNPAHTATGTSPATNTYKTSGAPAAPGIQGTAKTPTLTHPMLTNPAKKGLLPSSKKDDAKKKN